MHHASDMRIKKKYMMTKKVMKSGNCFICDDTAISILHKAGLYIFLYLVGSNSINGFKLFEIGIFCKVGAIGEYSNSSYWEQITIRKKCRGYIKRLNSLSFAIPSTCTISSPPPHADNQWYNAILCFPSSPLPGG